MCYFLISEKLIMILKEASHEPDQKIFKKQTSL